MGRKKEKPRNNVVSIRLTEEEARHFERLVGKTHKSISHFMRDAFNFFLISCHEQVSEE